ncbi:hypothetical protein D9619_000147 [Psilocybe cf. subviscida]|uniref:Uncharacterized protein n=1 Tax=Psilocybe cf. subviscida TaxID=2480587 RepID=A0A8H5F3D8_9AGAR|nr:hypothetical protein D9619_000147 [Psilocybe cf. subviscida]
MRIFAQAISVLATVLLLLQLGVYALPIPTVQQLGPSQLKKSDNAHDHHEHHEHHHKQGGHAVPIDDTFFHYGRSVQPASN